MSIIESIKSFFFKQKHQKKENLESKQKDSNSITFCVDGFGKQWVYVELVNTDEYSCNEFSKLLFAINEGNYENSILNLMTTLSEQHPNLAPAIENILVGWGRLLTKTIENNELSEAKTQSKNRPFIRPRNVFLGNNK